MESLYKNFPFQQTKKIPITYINHHQVEGARNLYWYNQLHEITFLKKNHVKQVIYVGYINFKNINDIKNNNNNNNNNRNNNNNIILY